jgi:hypothetical protein
MCFSWKAIFVRLVSRILRALNTRFDRNALEGLRDNKRLRNFFRLASSKTVQHEFRGQYGHPSSYAFVRFECVPADDLSLEVSASWPATVSEDDRTVFEVTIAESVADLLLDGLYQHTGCALTLAEVRYDEIGSSEVAFMKATRSAIQDLLGADWTVVVRPAQ